MVLAAATASAESKDVWRTLPPNPTLPPGAVGKVVSTSGAPPLVRHVGQAIEQSSRTIVARRFSEFELFWKRYLLKNGYYVVAIDSRGHGRSTRSDAPMTYHLMAEDVIQVLDVLKIPRVSLVSWSDGGCIGYDLAINHPDRLTRLFAFGSDADV